MLVIVLKLCMLEKVYPFLPCYGKTFVMQDSYLEHAPFLRIILARGHLPIGNIPIPFLHIV
jgi:hypothetical protein